MHPLLEELAAGVGSGALSEIQFHIAMDRATNWTAWTYARDLVDIFRREIV
jgi:hypothetical protein